MLCCALLGGCLGRQPYVSAERKLRGLVIVLPGIEGRGRLNELICRGLNEGGVNWAIELHDWTTGVPGNYLYHLRAAKRNRKQAAAIAERVRRYNVRYPGKPVVLVGQSGGGAIAVWAAEAMGSAEGLTGVVVLAPTLSPGYDLRAALENTERGVVNFYSPRDWIFLGVGTSMWGTMDGKHTSSAGRFSFDAPEAPSPSSPYRKLFQLSWNREMSDVGHVGGHLSSGAEAFVARYVAPLLRAEKWDEDLMVRVLTQDWAEPPRLPPPERWQVEPVPQNGPGKKRTRRTRPPEAAADDPLGWERLARREAAAPPSTKRGRPVPPPNPDGSASERPQTHPAGPDRPPADAAILDELLGWERLARREAAAPPSTKRGRPVPPPNPDGSASKRPRTHPAGPDRPPADAAILDELLGWERLAGRRKPAHPSALERALKSFLRVGR